MEQFRAAKLLKPGLVSDNLLTALFYLLTGDFAYYIRARFIDIFGTNVRDFVEETAPSTLTIYKMRVKQVVFAVTAAVSSLANAQQTAWGKCGGQGIAHLESLDRNENMLTKE